MNELTIQQMAQQTELSVHTLRYYERIGLIHPIARADNGHRRYSADDIGWIEFLKKLRATGMPISQMQRYAQLQAQGEHTIHERLAMLEAHQRALEDKIAELMQYMETINYKVNLYREIAAKYEREGLPEPEYAR